MPDTAKTWIAMASIVVFGLVGVALGLSAYLPVAAVLTPVVVLGLVFAPATRAVLVLVAAASFVFVWAGPHLAIGSVDLYLAEGLVFVVLLATVLDMARSEGSMALLADPISVFVGLLLLAATIGIVVGLSRGVGVSEVAAGARPMLFMAAFLTFRFALERDESRGRTLGVLTVASVVVALGQVLQVILGPSVKLFALGTFSDLIELDVATGFLRVRPPGLYLEYVAACMAAACLIWGPKRLRLWAGGSFAILFVGLLVSFNRNMLIGLVVGLTVAAAFSRKRSRFVAVALVATTLVFVAFLYFGGGSTSNPVINRFASLADPSARSIALQDRVYENGLALVSIGKSPIVGIGWGTPYGASAVRNFEGIVAARSRDYVHNQYLASWMRMGILGLVAFVGLMVSTIWGAARAGRRAGSEETAWLGPATVAAMTALAVSSIVDLVILSPSNVPVLAFVAALGSYLWGLANAPSEVEVP